MRHQGSHGGIFYAFWGKGRRDIYIYIYNAAVKSTSSRANLPGFRFSSIIYWQWQYSKETGGNPCQMLLRSWDSQGLRKGPWMWWFQRHWCPSQDQLQLSSVQKGLQEVLDEWVGEQERQGVTVNPRWNQFQAPIQTLKPHSGTHVLVVRSMGVGVREGVKVDSWRDPLKGWVNHSLLRCCSMSVFPNVSLSPSLLHSFLKWDLQVL